MPTALDDAAARLQASTKFQRWRRPSRQAVKYKAAPRQVSRLPKRRVIGKLTPTVSRIAERHYSPTELATLWGVSAETVRAMFREEPGVLKIGENGTKFKRGYKTLRIPESVAERVHTRLSE